MADEQLTTLYTWSELMSDAGQEVGNKHEDQYKSIIGYVKTSDDRVKKLAAQMIARFFKYFPQHEESAFDAVVDLCESVDVDMRKHATMAMITICRDCKHLVSKAADILIQLYQTDQASEVNLINQSLMTLLNLDIQKFLQSFFTNFEDGSEVVRERALKFLSSKIHTVAESALTKEVEEQLMTYSKKAMEDVTKDEFISFIGILSKLKIAKTATGQAMIVLVIKSQAELEKEFDPKDTDALDKFLLCTKHTIPMLSRYNPASEYVNYICLKILPKLSEMASSGNDLKVLQALAEMSPHVYEDNIPKLIDLDKCQQAVFDKFIEYLPLPQSQTEQLQVQESDQSVTAVDDPSKSGVSAAEVISENEKRKQSEAEFKFTHIEYLIFTFHQLCRLKPEFFSESLQNDVRIRLQNLALGCSKYLDLLSVVKPGEDLNKDESQIRSVALRTTKNISILVKDLFKKPPQFKSSVLLSCKPLAPTRPSETPPSKTESNRKTPQTERAHNQNNNNNNNNNNNYHKHSYNNRQSGQKFRYQQSYNQTNQRKRPRYAR